MSLIDDITSEVSRIFKSRWTTATTKAVPEPASVGLERNDARVIENGTVLYADLSGSTAMVQNQPYGFAAEVYRSYLYSAAKLIRAEGGTITAYDGDRVMAVFVGDYPNTIAARTALKINFAVREIINPAIAAQYGAEKYTVKQVVGIDTSPLFVARTGVRRDNDLVWVGRAANFAAKLTSLAPKYHTYITGDVFDKMANSSKFGGTPNRLMWTKLRWTQMSDMRIYGSAWTWSI